MKKFTLTLSAAALALSGATIAYANHHGGKGGADTNGDGVVSLEETLARSDKRFAKMDVDGNGQLDAADREARRAEWFAKTDVNGDGEVTQEEMQTAREARRAERTERRSERREQRFAQLDTDGSGGLSETELEARKQDRKGARAKAGGKRHGSEARGARRHGGRYVMKMLRQADTNGDKAVTKAEFDTAVQARFAKVDTDNSGTITKEERKAAREARKAAHKAERRSQS